MIWGRLKTEFDLGAYWGVDLKRRAGRLKYDSAEIVASKGFDYDVIDVDTYGSPWKHWKAITAHLCGSLTVFLTVGNVLFGGPGKNALEKIGLSRFKIPPGLLRALGENILEFQLGAALEDGWTIERAEEALPRGQTARYIGVRMSREKPQAPADPADNG